MSDKLSLNDILNDWRDAPIPDAKPATVPLGFDPIPGSVVTEEAPLLMEAKSVFKYPKFFDRKDVQKFDSDLMEWRSQYEVASSRGLSARDYESWFSDIPGIDDTDILAEAYARNDLPDNIMDPIRRTFDDAYGRAFEKAAWDWEEFDMAADEVFGDEVRYGITYILENDKETPYKDYFEDYPELADLTFEKIGEWFSASFDQKTGTAIVTYAPKKSIKLSKEYIKEYSKDFLGPKWAKGIADAIYDSVAERFVKRLRERVADNSWENRMEFGEAWKEMLKENKAELRDVAEDFKKWVEEHRDEYE